MWPAIAGAGQVDRATFSVVIPDSWRESTPANGKPGASATFISEDICTYSVNVFDRVPKVSAAALADNQRNALARLISVRRSTDLSVWCGRRGHGTELEGFISGRRYCARTFAFENHHHICVTTEFGRGAFWGRYRRIYEVIGHSLRLK
jgi:hypothetical protein